MNAYYRSSRISALPSPVRYTGPLPGLRIIPVISPVGRGNEGKASAQIPSSGQTVNFNIPTMITAQIERAVCSCSYPDPDSSHILRSFS